MERPEKKIHEFVAHSSVINCIAFGRKSSQVFATGGEDCKINVYRTADASNIWTLANNKSPVECLCFDSEEQYVVSGNMNGSIKMYDMNEGKLARSLVGHKTNVCSVQYHNHGDFIVSGSLDCTMKVWDARAKSCLQTYTGHQQELTCVRFSPDGRWVASSSKDSQIHLWDLVAGKILNSFQLQPAYATSFEFNPNDLVMAAITSSRVVKLWDLENMKQICSTSAESSPIRAMAFTNDDAVICTATKDNLKVWSAESTNSGVCRLQGELENIGWDKMSTMVVTPQNNIIAGAFVSHYVSVWSVDVAAVLASSRRMQSAAAAIMGQKIPAKAKDLTISSDPVVDMSPPPKQSLQTRGGVAAVRTGGRVTGTSPSPRQNTATDSVSTGCKSDHDWPSSKAQPQRGRDMTEDDCLAPVAADEKLSNYSSSNNGGAAGARDDSKCGAESPSIDEMVMMIARPMSAVPEVRWETEHGAMDMATSISESFLKRQQDSKSCVQSRPVRYQPAAVIEDDEYSDAKCSDVSSSAGNINAKLLESMLPDSRFQGGLGKDKDNQRKEPTVAAGGAGGYRLQSRDAAIADALAEKARVAGQVTGAGAAGQRRGSPDIARAVASVSATVMSPGGEEGTGPTTRRGSDRTQQSSTSSSSSSSPAAVIRTTPPRSKALPAAATSSSSTSSSPPSSSSSSSRGIAAEDSASTGPAAEQCADRVAQSLCSSSVFASNLTLRLHTMRQLRKHWESGEIVTAIDLLQQIQSSVQQYPGQQLVLVCDFFAALDLSKSNTLTLDHATRLIQVLTIAMESPEGWLMERLVSTVLKSFCDIVDLFGEIIRVTRSVMIVGASGIAGGGGGVDLNREERLRRCNECHGYLRTVQLRLETLRRQYRKHAEITLLLSKLTPLLNDL